MYVKKPYSQKKQKIKDVLLSLETLCVIKLRNLKKKNRQATILDMIRLLLASGLQVRTPGKTLHSHHCLETFC